MEIVASTQKISESYLVPVLEMMLVQFPFTIPWFHADNGSEFVNKVVAEVLNKRLIRFTRSRPRHSDDNAPSSTKNSEQTRDKEMKQTKKGNQWYLGMKAHVGMDSKRGLVHSVVVTNAAVHDSRVMDELLHGEEGAVYGDKAYASEEKKKEYEGKGIGWCMKRKASRGHQFTREDVNYNHRHGQIRAKGEHAFLVVKHLWHYRKVRYKGLYKNAAQMFSLFALANQYMVRNELRTMPV